jgi:hypothetical protein
LSNIRLSEMPRHRCGDLHADTRETASPINASVIFLWIPDSCRELVPRERMMREFPVAGDGDGDEDLQGKTCEDRRPDSGRCRLCNHNPASLFLSSSPTYHTRLPIRNELIPRYTNLRMAIYVFKCPRSPRPILAFFKHEIWPPADSQTALEYGFP